MAAVETSVSTSLLMARKLAPRSARQLRREPGRAEPALQRVIARPRAPVGAQQAGVKTAVGFGLAPVVDVHPLDAAAVLLRKPEQPPDRGVRPLLALREERAAVREHEFDDAARLREPDLARHGVEQLLRAAVALTAPWVRVAVVVKAPEPGAVGDPPEVAEPADHVRIVDYVGGHDPAAAARLAELKVEASRAIGMPEGRLRAVVRLVPDPERAELGPARPEGAHGTTKLADARQLARLGGALRPGRGAEGHERVDAAGARRREPAVHALAPTRAEGDVPGHDHARLAKAELAEVRIGERAVGGIAEADRHGGGRAGRGGDGKGEQRKEEGERRRRPERWAWDLGGRLGLRIGQSRRLARRLVRRRRQAGRVPRPAAARASRNGVRDQLPA